MNITTIFWDLGGVVLTNAWDRDQRVRVLSEFGITAKPDLDEFGDRHREVASLFEIGQCTLQEYLDMTLFGIERNFTREQFKEKMFEQSQALEGLEVLKAVADTGKYFLATLNNESRELNEHRFQKFGLTRYFRTFFSSCYLKMMKPNPDIYQTALNLTQREAGECVFIDDRAQNAEAARRLGIHAIEYKNPTQLKGELKKFGVSV